MVIVLFIVFTVIGAAIGYGVLGSGKVSEVFYKSTWTHVVDLVEKE
jgi:hypothetical protein